MSILCCASPLLSLELNDVEKVDRKRIFFVTDRASRSIKTTRAPVKTCSGGESSISFGIESLEISRHALLTMRRPIAELFSWGERSIFYQRLSAALEKSEKNEIVVFVHGCCVNHKKAGCQTRSLMKFITEPVVLFDWATVSAFYPQALQRHPRSQAGFNAFLRDLKARYPDVRVTVIAYSVGAFLIRNFCIDRAVQQAAAEVQASTKPQFESIVFLRADGDVAALRRQLDWITPHSRLPVQFWVADNDLQINLSGMLRRFSPAGCSSPSRIGALGSWRKVPACPHTQVLDLSALRLGHEIPYELLGLLHDRTLTPGAVGKYSISRTRHDVFRVTVGAATK